MNEIRLSYVTIKYEEPIVYFTYKEGVELGFPEIRELISCSEQLSEGKPYVTFSDARMEINLTNEGRRVLENPDNMPLFRGTAVLVKNDLYKYAVNFLNHFHKPVYPFRAFTSKQEAVEWLSTLMVKEEKRLVRK